MHARSLSNSKNPEYSEAIMDVTESAVADAFKKHSVKLIIHGHTHRPEIHKYPVLDASTSEHTQNKTRIVLGDWYEQASYLELANEVFTLYVGEQSTTMLFA